MHPGMTLEKDGIMGSRRDSKLIRRNGKMRLLTTMHQPLAKGRRPAGSGIMV